MSGLPVVLPTRPCPVCGGDGTIPYDLTGGRFDTHMQQWYPSEGTMTCDTCGGSGWMDVVSCRTCGEDMRECSCDEETRAS